MLPLLATNCKDDRSNRARIAGRREKRGMPKAEAMARYVDKCNKQPSAYSPCGAAGSGGGGSACRMLTSLQMPTKAETGSAVHSHGLLVAAAVSITARPTMAVSTRG
jgi:hypothetical protein